MNKARILYEPQMFDLQNYGGITRYFSNLITALKQSNEYDVELPLVYSTNYYVRNFPQLLNSNIFRFLLKKNGKRKKLNNLYARLKIKTSNFDILHATYYDPYFLKNLNKPLVITVHDMIHENYPELFADAPQVIQQKKTVMEAANLIIAISKYTRQEIIRHYPYLGNKIKVVYHGLPQQEVCLAQEILPEKFLLYVGDRAASYKNFGPLIQAIFPLFNRQPNLRLICTGGGQFSLEELELFVELGIHNQITQVNASDALINQLYAQAQIFIYPSIEEGFGLPILEAFRAQCPIACSNTSCLPEIGGDAVSYFDPTDIESITPVISELVSNKDLRKKLISKGIEQLKKFTFETCLAQTMNCYKSLIIKKNDDKQ